jgi:hypothetical protein
MMISKKLFKLFADNYFISVILACVLFVGLVSVYKLFFVKDTYVYAKVKMGQGLWWASTAKPAIWFVEALKKGDVERSLTGKATAEILNVHYYPWWGSGQYDVYLYLKLKVSGNPKTGKYNFKRSTIGVGSPIDFEFPSAQFSGTVVDMNSEPIKEQLFDKAITLTKKNAFPWEYDAIKIGDAYFNGEHTVFEILEKKAIDTYTQSSDVYGNSTDAIIDSKKYIQVKAKIKVLKKNNQLIFGEEQIVTPGKNLNISTSSFTFQEYVVGGVE